ETHAVERDVAEAARLDRERQRHLAEVVRRRGGRVARNARTQEVAAAGLHVLSLDRPSCHGSLLAVSGEALPPPPSEVKAAPRGPSAEEARHRTRPGTRRP